ncbi:MAG: efflux RND transporter periplasmic adaptor subunit [Mangrovibacterium sp.]
MIEIFSIYNPKEPFTLPFDDTTYRINQELCSVKKNNYLKYTKKMKRVITMAILAGTICSCGKSSHEGSEVRNVSLTTPVLLESTRTKSYPGIVREAHNINLGFKTAGQIGRIYVKEGDYVRKGELLAQLDDADYRLDVEALQIQYNQLKDEVARIRRLFDRKSVSANDFEKASAELKQLGVELQVNKNKLNYTKLYAPTDGYVQTVNFSPAEMVDAGTALFTLLDVSHMEVVADIPVDEYRQRNHFIQYYCETASIEEKFSMKLLSLTPKADGNQLYQLRLTFAGQPDKRLTAGMNVEIGINMTDSAFTGALAVPLRAVFRDGEDACVWVFRQDSTVSKRTIVLDGTDVEGRAVIVKGLSAGEQIVRAGVNVLQEGQRVGVVEKPGKTNVGGLL